MAVNFKITWSRVQDDCDLLAQKINNCDCIIALGRGGLVPGTMLSYNLNCNVFNFGVKRYKDNNTPGNFYITQTPGDYFIKNFNDKKIIVLDDVSDHGDTLLQAKSFLEQNNFKQFKFATLYIKKSTKFLPDYYVSEFEDNIWLDFPWEFI